MAKANEAFSWMASQLGQSPTDPRAIGMKKLCNGSIVYELNSPEATNWLRKGSRAFMDGFGGTLVVRDRAITMIVEYIPVFHSPDALAENRKIECDTGIEEGSLLATRWIKPPQHHAHGQWEVHLITQFHSPEAANHVIREKLDVGAGTWHKPWWSPSAHLAQHQ